MPLSLIPSSTNMSFGYSIFNFPMHQNFWPQGSVHYIKTISKYCITCLASNIHHNILTIIIMLQGILYNIKLILAPSLL
jgi:hypothetical protein